MKDNDLKHYMSAASKHVPTDLLSEFLETLTQDIRDLDIDPGYQELADNLGIPKVYARPFFLKQSIYFVSVP